MTGSFGTVDLVRRNIEKAGSAVSIALWCMLSSEQLTILENPTLLRLLFLSAYSTGKTMLLRFKALHLAKAGQKVLYLFCLKTSIANSDFELLICHQLRDLFKDQPNITLKSFHYKDYKKLAELVLQHPEYNVMIDELFVSTKQFLPLMEQLSNAVSKNRCLWVCLAGHEDSEGWSLEEAVEFLKRNMWHVPIMAIAFRYARIIAISCLLS